MATNYTLSIERIREVLYQHPELGITSETLNGRQMYRQKANPKAMGVWISRKNVYDIINHTLDQAIKSRRGVLIDRQKNPPAWARFMEGRHESPQITVENQYISDGELNEILALEKDDEIYEVDAEEVEDVGEADAGIERVISEEEKDTVEYSFVNVIAVPNQEKREPMASPVLKKKVYDGEFSLDALLGKTIISPMGSTSFKAYCVVQPKGKKEKEMVPDKSVESFSVGNVGGVVGIYKLSAPLYKVEEPTPLAAVEIVVTPLPARNKRKLFGYFAKAAFVAAAGIASLVGYNHLTSSSVPVTGTVMQNYRGSPAVEVIAPVNGAKHAELYSGLPSETEGVDNQAKPVEQPTVAHQVAPSGVSRKAIKRFPPSYDPYDSDYHTVEKGDTVGGLYEDYAARGGTLSRPDYFKAIRMANSHLENINTIFVGQEIKVPQ